MEDQIDQRFLEQNNDSIYLTQIVLHNVNIENKHKQPTQIFEMGKEYFKQCHQILAIYTALKVIAAISLIIIRETLYSNEQFIKDYASVFDYAYLEIWMYFSLLHSSFATFYYVELLICIDNPVQCERVVEQTGQLIEVDIPEGMNNQERQAYINDQVDLWNQEMVQRLEIDGQIEESRRISIIASDIKKKLLQNNFWLNVIGKGCFIAFQFIQMWGLIFYFKQNQEEDNNQLHFYPLYRGYLFSVVFMGIYQYLEIYIMTLLVLIFLPILLFYTFYDWIKNMCQKRRERRRIDESLKESMFSLQEPLDGDNECAICMNLYEEKEKIAVLPCNSKHRFHSSCVRSWLEVNSKCPLCRCDVFVLPEEI